MPRPKRTALDEMRDLDYRLDDIAEEWLRTLEGQHYSPHTIRSYQTRLTVFARWFATEFGRGPLMADLGTGDAGKRVGTRYKNALQREGRSAATVNQAISALQGLARYALGNSYLEKDTMHQVGRVKLGRRQPTNLSDDQLAAIEGHLDEGHRYDFRNLILFRLMLDTGLRCSEVCSITFDRLQLETVGGRPLPNGSIRIVGKGNKERLVGLGEWTTKKLRRYLRHARGVPASDQADEFVFLTKYGTRLAPAVLYSIVVRMGQVAGVKLHPHALRHTFATNYVTARPNGESGNVAELMDLLGHTDPAMSLRYVHLAGSRANVAKQQRLSHTDYRLQGASHDQVPALLHRSPSRRHAIP